jgi:lipid II:glycine glycyltransferase (peptidoglycan interpeptide bridge formation enzyme)
MQFSLITDPGEWQSLEVEWQVLVAQTHHPLPFLEFWYQKTWWHTFGGGEWSSETSRLQLIIARQDGQLIGAAPLFYSEKADNPPALRFIGQIEVSDYLDFLCPLSELPHFMEGLLVFIKAEPGLLSRTLDLANFEEDSASLSLLRELCEQKGVPYTSEVLQPSPYIPMKADWEDYLASISKKQRHEIRRKMRNVENSLVESDLYFTENPETLREDVDSFIKMMAQDPNKRAFLTEPMRQHIHNIAQSAFDQGWLQLAFLTMDGNKAAAYLSFHFDNRLWLYNSAWEWEYRDYSPGWLLLAHLIKWAVDNNLAELDFMRGDEPYKYKFGGVDRHIYRVTLSPSSAI